MLKSAIKIIVVWWLVSQMEAERKKPMQNQESGMGAIINRISYWLWVARIYPVALNNRRNLRWFGHPQATRKTR